MLRRNFRKKNLGKKSKRFYRRRRGLKRKNTKVSQLVSYNNQISNRMRLSRTYINIGSYSGGTSGLTVNAILNPQLVNMPDLASLQALFAYYKIKKITYTFTWKDFDGTNNITLGSATQPTLYFSSNKDGNLTNANSIFDHKNVKSMTFTPEKNVIKFSIYPTTLSQVYYSSVASGYKSNPQVWIDMDYVSVPHYGALLYIDSVPAGTIVYRTEEWIVDFKESA
jgi:hypothetical protein